MLSRTDKPGDMMQSQWTAVDCYFTELLVPSDAALDAALEASRAHGLPPHHVAPNQGKLLMLLAKMCRARRILEIGTLGGYSTIWLARGLQEDGNLITLESNETYAEIASANIARAGLGDVVEIRIGNALESLAKLAAEGQDPFDLIFIDADKENHPDYFACALTLCRPGSVIVADNVVLKGAVIDDESGDPNVQGIRRFAELAAAEPRVSMTAIQTVGSKGHDGFAIALVTGE